MRYSCMLIRRAKKKNTDKIKSGKNMDQQNSHLLLVQMQNIRFLQN